jgi:hypothetical protein
MSAEDRTVRLVTADAFVAYDKPSPEEKAGVAEESGPKQTMGDTADTTSIRTSTRITSAQI